MKQAVLVAVKKGGPISNITLTNDKFLIGRSLNNTHIIEDVNISRNHCVLEIKDGSWYITDKSSNGTWLNGNLIDKSKSYKLLQGDIVSLSPNIKFEYQIDSKSDSNKTNESDQKLLTDDEFNNIAETVLTEAEYLDGPDFNSHVANTNVSDAPLESQQSNMDSKLNTKIKDVTPKNTHMDYAEDELQCSICTEMFVKAVTLSCSHTFCNHCITQWRKNQSVCPICRAEIKMQFSTIVLDSFIDKIVENGDEELKQRRKELIEERQVVTVVTPGPSTSNVSNTRRRRATEPIEINSSESSEDEDNSSDRSHSSSSPTYSDDGSEDEWANGYDYNGIPGEYYGGYGSCFSCGQRGHWSNGCPHKRRRH